MMQVSGRSLPVSVYVLLCIIISELQSDSNANEYFTSLIFSALFGAKTYFGFSVYETAK